MKTVGLHIRWYKSISEVIEKAKKLNISLFQCFLFDQVNCKYFKVNQELENLFSQVHDIFLKRYIHASYYINLADPRRERQPLLKKELYLAQRLSFTNYILHPGAVPKGYTKQEGINSIARFINRAAKEFKNIVFILENMPHCNRSIGGNLQDLYEIMIKLEYPERVKVCLDTAHAYVYGYNLTTPLGREIFIQQVQSLFKENIELIHLNDTRELCASKKDCHALLGEGFLSGEPLESLMINKLFKDRPKILELPRVSEKEEQEALELANHWLE